MVPSTETGLTHESNWATLTFQVGSGPGQTKAGGAQQLKSDHGHDHGEESDQGHEHDHIDEGIPSYVFWIGSLFIVGILFFIFNRRK
jgi:ABC-type Zn2+ transport system substrate-binding protein/surface adhesin